jgi:hypothetical protein
VSLPVREDPGHVWVISVGQLKAPVVLGRRLREPLEGIANSAPQSAGLAICVGMVLPNASRKRIQRLARQARVFETDGASRISISTPELPDFSFIAT